MVGNKQPDSDWQYVDGRNGGTLPPARPLPPSKKRRGRLKKWSAPIVHNIKEWSCILAALVTIAGLAFGLMVVIVSGWLELRKLLGW